MKKTNPVPEADNAMVYAILTMAAGWAKDKKRGWIKKVRNSLAAVESELDLIERKKS